MTLRLQIIVGVLIVLSILVIANMVRKRKLELKYALVWFLVGAVVLVFDIFPQLLGTVTRWMGIDLAVNMLFFLGFVFSLLIIFTLTVAVSKLSEKVKRLTQEVALLEEKIETPYGHPWMPCGRKEERRSNHAGESGVFTGVCNSGDGGDDGCLDGSEIA